jgi:uncharacterized protein YdbL (DUF1318 family)
MGLAPVISLGRAALPALGRAGSGILTGSRAAARLGGRTTRRVGLFGSGAAAMFLGGLFGGSGGSGNIPSPGSRADGDSGQPNGAATQVAAGAAVGSGAGAEINIPALSTPQTAKKVSNPTLSTLNESIVRLTSIALAIADNLRDQQNLLKAQLESSTDLARESAIEGGASAAGVAGAAGIGGAALIGDELNDALSRLEEQNKDQGSSLGGIIGAVLAGLGITSLVKNFFRSQTAAAEAAKRAALVERASGMVSKAFRAAAAISGINDMRQGDVVSGALKLASAAPLTPAVTVPALGLASLASFDDIADKAAAAGAAAETIAGRQVVTRVRPGIFGWATSFGVEQGMEDKSGRFVAIGQVPTLVQAIWDVNSSKANNSRPSANSIKEYNRDLQLTKRVEGMLSSGNFTWDEMFNTAEIGDSYRKRISARQAAAGSSPIPQKMIGGDRSFTEIRSAVLQEIEAQGGTDAEKMQRAIDRGVAPPTGSMSWAQLAKEKGATGEELETAKERLKTPSTSQITPQRGLDFSDLRGQPIDTSYYARRAETPTDITPDDFRLQQSRNMIPFQSSIPTGPGATPPAVGISPSGDLSIGNVPDPTYHGINAFFDQIYFEPNVRTAA